MPRPKPPSILKPRCIRLSDEEWDKFREMGGSEWLRKALGTRPARYYEVFEPPFKSGQPRPVYGSLARAEHGHRPYSTS